MNEPKTFEHQFFFVQWIISLQNSSIYFFEARNSSGLCAKAPFWLKAINFWLPQMKKKSASFSFARRPKISQNREVWALTKNPRGFSWEEVDFGWSEILNFDIYIYIPMPCIWMNLCVGHQAQQVSWRLGVQLPFFMMPVLRICSSQGLRHELSKGCRWFQNPMWRLLCFGRSLQDDSEICLNDFLIMLEDLHQLWCLGDEGIENIWKPHIETPVMSTLTISKVPSHCMT